MAEGIGWEVMPFGRRLYAVNKFYHEDSQVPLGPKKKRYTIKFQVLVERSQERENRVLKVIIFNCFLHGSSYEDDLMEAKIYLTEAFKVNIKQVKVKGVDVPDSEFDPGYSSLIDQYEEGTQTYNPGGSGAK